MNTKTVELCKAALVLLLTFLLVHANDRINGLKEENQKLTKQLEELPPDGFNGHNGVMFHLLASENYRLGGEAKKFLPKNMVIPHDEVNDLLKNGWPKLRPIGGVNSMPFEKAADVMVVP